MFPEFVPEKAMWVIAALATVAVFVTRAHADVVVSLQPASPIVHVAVLEPAQVHAFVPNVR
jgi:hypothetical protein